MTESVTLKRSSCDESINTLTDGELLEFYKTYDVLIVKLIRLWERGIYLC